MEGENQLQSYELKLVPPSGNVILLPVAVTLVPPTCNVSRNNNFVSIYSAS